MSTSLSAPIASDTMMLSIVRVLPSAPVKKTSTIQSSTSQPSSMTEMASRTPLAPMDTWPASSGRPSVGISAL